MDIRQIQYFVALYEEGSITKAARRAHVVQPAISQQIKRLEEDFGVQLFDRAAQGMVPTAAAREFYCHCVALLAQLQKATGVLREASRQPVGRLTLGAQSSLNQFVLPAALQQFHERHPSIAVSARDGYRVDLIEWLNRGEIDFALLSTTKDRLLLASQTLCMENLVVIGHPDTLRGHEAMSGEALLRYPLVLHSRNKSMRTFIDSQFGLHGLEIRPEMEIDAMPSLLALARQPGWLAIVPRTAVGPRPEDGALAWLPLQRPSLQRQLVAAWSPQRLPSVYMQGFLQILRLSLADIDGVTVVPPSGDKAAEVAPSA